MNIFVSIVSIVSIYLIFEQNVYNNIDTIKININATKTDTLFHSLGMQIILYLDTTDDVLLFFVLIMVQFILFWGFSWFTGMPREKLNIALLFCFNMIRFLYTIKMFLVVTLAILSSLLPKQEYETKVANQ